MVLVACDFQNQPISGWKLGQFFSDQFVGKFSYAPILLVIISKSVSEYLKKIAKKKMF